MSNQDRDFMELLSLYFGILLSSYELKWLGSNYKWTMYFYNTLYYLHIKVTGISEKADVCVAQECATRGYINLSFKGC